MYKMKKCVKCNCEKIKEQKLSTDASMAMNGIINPLDGYVVYYCENCGYAELIRDVKKDKDYKPFNFR